MLPRPEDVQLIARSDLFDRDWYLREYPDVALLGADPAEHYLRVGARLLRNPGPAFDTRFYLEANPDVAARGDNPLVHYLTHGVEEGRVPLPRAIAPGELTEAIDIVVPVYGALEHVKACFASIAEHPDGFAVRSIVVNDGSDAETTEWLRAQAATDGRVELIEHEGNQGYTRAVNTGLRASSAPHVVILNSDTIVTPGWLRGLVRAMTSSPEVGLVGPLSNAASWQNVPVLYDEAGAFAINALPPGATPATMAHTVATTSNRSYPRLPFLNGFCTMIKRAVLDTVGLMDEERFPIGYGEENDYCIRAADAGFALVVADDVYVYHAKSQSFGHERRTELTRQGSEALKHKHSPEKFRALVEQVSRTEALDRVRARIARALDRGGARTERSLDRDDSPTHAPVALASDDESQGDVALLAMHILFLLPVKGGGGGAHSVVQEASEMRRLGVDARVAVPSARLPGFLDQYADIATARELFVGYRDEELCELADSFDIVVATFFSSMELLREIATRSPHVLPAYYVQDYEPLFYPEGSDDWRVARASYTLVQGALLFAKTHWLARRVAAEHGLPVHKVEPSIDHSVYVPRPRADDGLVHLSAMIRPQTPYRGAERTMRVLKRLEEARPERVTIEIFGCAALGLSGLEQGFSFRNHGVLTRPKVAALLGRSDLFIDLSDYQAFGRTALEAMACGCAAAVPSRGGTDEYAIDGENSLVLDPFDEEAAFARLSALVASPEALGSMKAAALRTASRYSAHSAAVSELILFHQELRRHRASCTRAPAPRLLLLPRRGADGEPFASAYVRLIHPYRTAEIRQHWRVDVLAGEDLPKPGSGRALVVQGGIRHFELGRANEWLAAWRAYGGKLLFDVDEDLLVPEDDEAGHSEQEERALAEHALWLTTNADVTIVSTEALAEALLPYAKRVKVVPNRLRASLWRLGAPRASREPQGPSPSGARDGLVRIGYFGTPERFADLELVADAVAQIEREYAGVVRVEVIGAFQRRAPIFGERVGLPKRHDYPSFVSWLHNRIDWDIGIVPVLADGRARARSNLKFLEMAALELAIVCSDASCLRSIAENEKNCLVVPNRTEEWYWALRRLIERRELRVGLARAARELVASDWTIEAAGRSYLDAIGKPEPARARRPGRSWRAPGADGATGKGARGAGAEAAAAALEAGTWAAASSALWGVRKRLIPRWRKTNDTLNEQPPAAAPAPAPTSLPKVMVGTMHSGEQELDACKAAIGRQRYPRIEHVVISGLRNMEAHDRLYRTFLESDAELLVKIDADMVIVDERFVERVVEVCRACPELGIMQMAILDFYSGGEIQGVNAYTKKMSWSKERQDVLFTDTTETEASRRKVVWATFARSVVHSPNPAPFQAFHFGVHRGLKVLRALEAGAVGRAREQLMYLERTYQHYGTRRTRNLLFACLGAERAFRGEYAPASVDYDNPAMRLGFAPFEELPTAELVAMTERLRGESTGNAALDALRSQRQRIAERPTLQRLLFLLPHLGLYGGVNRFLEIARHAELQGIEACVAVRTLEADDRQRVERDFADIRVMTVEQAQSQRWDAVLCGDYSSGLMTMLPWFDCALSGIYLLNGRELRHLNEMQARLAAPDLVLACSSYAAEQCPGLAPLVVAGGVDTQLFCPGERPVREPGQPFRVGAPCGRNRPSKRFVDAVAACEALQAKGLAVELHVVNSEPLTIETTVPYVCHVGLRRGEVASYLRSLDVFVCPEEDGGWNNPAAEAMACGVPVVCTRAGTTDFAIDGETALVVPARDVARFAAAVERVLVDPDLGARLRKAAVRQMRAFSWAALTRNLIDAIESARPDRERRASANRQARRRIAAALVG